MLWLVVRFFQRTEYAVLLLVGVSFMVGSVKGSDEVQYCYGQGKVEPGQTCYLPPETLALGALCVVLLLATMNFVSGLMAGWAGDRCAGGLLGGGPFTVGMGADGIVETLQHIQFYSMCAYINGFPVGAQAFLEPMGWTMLFLPAPYDEKDTRKLMASTKEHGIEGAVNSWFYIGAIAVGMLFMNSLATVTESLIKLLAKIVSSSSKADKAAIAVADKWKTLNIIPVVLRFPAFPLKVIIALYQGLVFGCFMLMRSTYPLQLSLGIALLVVFLIPVLVVIFFILFISFYSGANVIYTGVGFQTSFDNVFKLWDKNRKSIIRKIHRIYMLKVIFSTSGEWTPRSVDELDESDEVEVKRTIRSAKIYNYFGPLFSNYRGPFRAFYLPINMVLKIYMAFVVGLLGEWIPGIAQISMIWPIALTRIIIIMVFRPYNDRIDLALEFVYHLLDLLFLTGLLVYLSSPTMQVTFMENVMLTLATVPILLRVVVSAVMMISVGSIKGFLNTWEVARGGIAKDIQTFVGNTLKASILELKEAGAGIFKTEKMDLADQTDAKDGIDEVLDIGTKQTALRFSDNIHKHLREGSWGQANSSRVPHFIQLIVVPLEEDEKLLAQLLRKRVADAVGFDVNEFMVERMEKYDGNKFQTLNATSIVVKVDTKRGLANTLSFCWSAVLLCTSERPNPYVIDDVAQILDAYLISDWGQYDITFTLSAKPLPGRGTDLQGDQNAFTQKKTKVTDPTLLEYENQGNDNYDATSSSDEEEEDAEEEVDFEKLLLQALDTKEKKFKMLKVESKMGLAGRYTECRAKLLGPSARVVALVADLEYMQGEFAIDQFEVLGVELNDIRESKNRKKKVQPSTIAHMQRELYSEEIEADTKFTMHPEDASPTRKHFLETKASVVSMGSDNNLSRSMSGMAQLKRMRSKLGSQASLTSDRSQMSRTPLSNKMGTQQEIIMEEGEVAKEKSPFTPT